MAALQQFLHMGGYAGYVWSAYAITAVVLGLNVVLPRRAERSALAQLARRADGQSNHHDSAQ